MYVSRITLLLFFQILDQHKLSRSDGKVPVQDLGKNNIRRVMLETCRSYIYIFNFIRTYLTEKNKNRNLLCPDKIYKI